MQVLGADGRDTSCAEDHSVCDEVVDAGVGGHAHCPSHGHGVKCLDRVISYAEGVSRNGHDGTTERYR